MTTDYRSRLLGDTGEDDPRGWAWGGPASDVVHVLLLVYADTADRLSTPLRRAHRRGGVRRPAAAAPAGHERADTDRRTSASMTASRSRSSRGCGARRTPRGGQGRGVRARLPQRVRPADGTTVAARSGRPARAAAPRRAEGAATSAATAPTSCCARCARTSTPSMPSPTPPPATPAVGRTRAQAALLAAKIVGRWPSGAPLVLAPGQDDPSLADSQRLRLPRVRRPRPGAARSARTSGGRTRATRSSRGRGPRRRWRSTAGTACCARSRYGYADIR